jgi:hypothetical protein
MGMVTKTPPRGERSACSAELSDDEDEPGGFKILPTDKVAGPMAATAVLPVASKHPNGVERLAELLAAKETELRALQRTHDEYVKSSCEYEKELERELERYELKLQSLELHVHSAEDAKAALTQTLTQAHRELAAARKREDALSAQVQDMKWIIQRLEQTNDELETATRVAQASIDGLQHRVDTLTEENVFLVQEKEDALAIVGTIKTESERKDDPEEVPENGAGATRSEAIGNSTGSSRAGPTRRSVRLPEVVESCLHITCSHEQCRQKAALVEVSTPQSTVDPTREKTRRKSLFMRFKVWASA